MHADEKLTALLELESVIDSHGELERKNFAEARRRLDMPRNNIESVAMSVGFRTADAFSRAFEREVGCRPSTYRALLGIGGAEEFSKRHSKCVGTLAAHV